MGTVTAAGGTVHWAPDAAAANRIVTDLVRGAGADEVVKVKSLTTDEIGLSDALRAAGIAAHETDLAELINQLAGDSPSHILVPAIHRNRAETRALFRRELPGTSDLSDDPAALAEAAHADNGDGDREGASPFRRPRSDAGAAAALLDG